MNYGSEFDNSTFDAGSGKKIRSYFSRIGFAFTAFILVWYALCNGILALVLEYYPEITKYDWFNWALNEVPFLLVALPLFLALTKKIPSMPPEKQKMSAGRYIVIALVGFFLMEVGNVIGNFFAAATNDPTNGVVEVLGKSSFIMSLIVTVVIAPVTEELIFRKVVIDRTRAYGERTAIIFSAILFGLYHRNIYQIFYAVALGLVFGYIYMKTGKLRLTIILHAAINLFCGILPTEILKRLDIDLVNGIIEDFYSSDFPMNLLNDTALYDAFIERITPMLPALLAFSAYSILISGAEIAGLVLFIINRRKVRFNVAEFQLPRERVGNTVYFNFGVFAAIISCLALTVVNMLQ